MKTKKIVTISMKQFCEWRSMVMTVSAKVKQTLANLNGIKSTLRIYSIQIQDEKAKSTYKEALEVTDKIIRDLEKRIQTLEFEEPQYKGF